MSFASPLFLWYFLPVVLLAVLLLPRSWRNGVLAAASLFFYTSGAGATVLLLSSCMVINYVAGRLLEPHAWEMHPQRRQLLITGVITVNLCALVIWKYAGFATEQFDNLAKLFGGDFPVVHLVLPIGISFYTFHHISYIVDVYRGERKPLRNPVSFATYIAMFPQLIAGPIVRYREIADQLHGERTHRLDDIASGFPRFAFGLCKKVLIADSIGPLVDQCYSTPAHSMTFSIAWLGAIGYTMQLYFDFSGYSDMAIGLGRMLGFRLPENFARPYSSTTITEFWRRWHMSLSRWFRDYVYIPLGGNRGGGAKTYRNLAIVFVLTGFWHGANWTYLVWGLYHGTLLIIERYYSLQEVHTRTPLPHLVRRVLTLLLVVIGWVLFRSKDIGSALTIIGHMFVPDFHGLTDLVNSAFTNQRLIIGVLALVIFFMPKQPVTGPLLEGSRSPAATTVRITVMTAGLAYSFILVASGTFSPFLYYQF